MVAIAIILFCLMWLHGYKTGWDIGRQTFKNDLMEAWRSKR